MRHARHVAQAKGACLNWVKRVKSAQKVRKKCVKNAFVHARHVNVRTMHKVPKLGTVRKGHKKVRKNCGKSA